MPEERAYKQCWDEEKYYDQLTSNLFMTADQQLIRFTYHNGILQAAVEDAANNSYPNQQLPVVFSLDVRLEHLVNRHLTKPKRLLHLCPNHENPELPAYVYVGIAPPKPSPIHNQAEAQKPASEVRKLL